MKQFNLIGLLALVVLGSIAIVGAEWSKYTPENVPAVPFELLEQPAVNTLGARFLRVSLPSDPSKPKSAFLSTKKWPGIPESISDNAQVTLKVSFLYYIKVSEQDSVEFSCGFFNGKKNIKDIFGATKMWTRYQPTEFSLTRDEYKNLLNQNALFELKMTAYLKDSKEAKKERQHVEIEVALADLFVSVIFENDQTARLTLDLNTAKEEWKLQHQTDDPDKPTNLDLENLDLWSNPSMLLLPVQLPIASFSSQKYVRKAKKANEPQTETKTTTTTAASVQPSGEVQPEAADDEPEDDDSEETNLVQPSAGFQTAAIFYTDLTEKSHNISWTSLGPIQEDQDLCFYFAYYSTIKTELKVQLFSPDPTFEWPADQTYKGKKPVDEWQHAPTVTSETVVAVLSSTNRNKANIREASFGWQNVEICIKRDAYPSRSSDLLPGGKYTLQLTSVLFEEAKKEHLIAVTFLNTVFVQNNNQHLQSFFADWATDGKLSSLQWNSPTQNNLVELKLNSDESNNQNSFEVLVSQPNNPFESDHRVFSNWISLIDSKYNDDLQETIDDTWMTDYFANSSDNSAVVSKKRALRFVNQITEEDTNIKSDLEFSFTLTNSICKGSLVVSVQNAKLVEMPLEKIELVCQSTQTKQVTFTISDEMKKHLDTDRVRLVFAVHLDSDPNSDNSKQLKISSFQLANACNSKSIDICNTNANHHSESGRNKCVLLSRKHYRCECNSVSHGHHCQYANYCLMAKQGNDKNGQEVCEKGEAEGCRPFGNDFFCKCPSGQFWHENKCQQVSPCLYAKCSLSENCVENTNLNDGYECVCADNYEREPETGKCLPNTCQNACSKGQECATIPGQDKPLCYCKPGFKLNPNKLTECIPVAKSNPLVRQWNNCQQKYNKFGECECYPGYTLSKKDNKTCIPNKDFEKNCKCSNNQYCVVKTVNKVKSYTCECLEGLKGNECDQDNYCHKKANKEDIEKLCGTKGASCSLKKDLFVCSSCDAQHEINPSNGRCVLRSDLCSQLNCDSKTEVCQLEYDDENNLKATCNCALGYVNKTDFKESKCVPACELHSCESSQGECIFDPIKGSPICTCRAGYSYENNVCTLSKNAVHIQGRVRLQPLPDRQEKQRKLMHLIRVQPKLNCQHAYDVISCLQLARELDNKLIDAHQPYKASYLSLQFESTLEEVLDVSDKKWSTAAGQTLNSKSQARILSLRPLPEDVDTELDLDFGFNREYLADIAMVVVGGELSEREKQWRNVCIRKPLIDPTTVLKTTTVASTQTTTTTAPVTTSEPITTVASQTNAVDTATQEQECIIHERLTWRPRQTNVGWLDLCRLQLHNCERYSVCQGARGQYKCGCEKGFKSVHQLLNIGFVQDKCLDIDECHENLHQCGASTVCENQLGSYRCNCLENFRRVDEFKCEETCSANFPCHHGRCEVFAKHYEICRCYDGFKGDDCNAEDQKVVNLKQTLISVIVGLCLLLLIALSIAFLFIQSSRSKARSLKRALRNEATEMQTRTRDSDKGQNNFAYQSEQNLTRV